MRSRSTAIANHHPLLRFDRPAVARVIATLDAHATRFTLRRSPSRPTVAGGVPPGELSLVFLTDAALARLHAKFLRDPSVTDVITFAGNPALGTAGEICVSADAALRQAPRAASPVRAAATARVHRRSAPRPIDAFSAELTLYVVHGWLHLAGFDDLQPAKKRVMRRAEARALRLLRQQPDGLPRFALHRPASRKIRGQ